MAFILLAVGDFITSVAISRVTTMVNKYIDNQQEYQTTNVKSKLDELKSYLIRIETAISAAEKKEVNNNSGLAKWLAELKDAVYDAEDMLDAVDYRVLADKAENMAHQSLPQEENQGKRKVPYLNFEVPTFHKVRKIFGTTAKRLLSRDEELNELVVVVNKIKNLVSDMHIFLEAVQVEHQNASDTSGTPDWRLTGPDSVEPKVFGRDTEIQTLVKMVKGTLSSEPKSGSDEMNYCLISIVAMGGMGKTTLAQSIFNHKELDNNCFDVKAWVCVSQNFDTKNIMIQLVESISEAKRRELRGCTSFPTIQKALKECLKGKKFLIVLDDIWDDVKTKWEALNIPFRFGKYGSILIVTTREEGVATVMGSKEIFKLPELDKKSFWEFFKQYAFGTSKPGGRLEDIGKQIANKLSGSPLSAKVVGRLLKSKLNEAHWTDILKSELWEVDTEKDGIIGCLKLSYDHLPSHIKPCFGYLSLFPQDYVFSKIQLTYTWMALGYVHSNDKKRPEDVAKDYINQLQSRCFLQERQQGLMYSMSDYCKTGYVIHDLLHSLATSIYGSEVHRVENGSGVIPRRVRHLFVSSGTSNNIVECVPNIKKLRSLVLKSNELHSLSEETLRKLIKSLRVLILLEVDDTFVERLSQTISSMVHLRYLGYYYTKHKIPESICKLHHLHAIDDKNMQMLPNRLSKLYNLRYVSQSEYFNRICEVSGFGQLTLLQELKYYRVSQKEGCMINELKNLKQIRGSLHIGGLDKVTDVAQARAAELDNKKHLEHLMLECDDIPKCYEFREHDEKVFEELLPHSNIKSLNIRGYRGAKWSSWLNQTWLSNLENLFLYDAILKVFPQLGQFSQLKCLYLWRLTLEHIGVEIYGEGETAFPSLEKLSIKELRNLTEWSAAKDGQHAFPRLKQAYLTKCPKLNGRAGFLNSPKEFKIGDADSIAELELEIDNMTVLTGNIHHLACIHKLHLWEMTIHMTTEHEQVFQNLVSLKKLHIFDCSLESKDEEGALKHLTSLEKLDIEFCKEFTSLPKLPPNLKKLLISDCPSISERYDWRHGRGNYWHEISHIPTIVFDGEILDPPALLPS